MNETQLWHCDICDKIILRISQNILILNLINTIKNMQLLLKNIKLLDQTSMNFIV